MNLKGMLILVLVLAILRPGFSQFKNTMLDNQEGTPEFVCQPSIAINPRHPNNIVAGSMPDNVYYTKDGGATWTKSKLSSPFGVYGEPTIVVDDKGNFFYFHLSDPTGGAGEFDSEKLDRLVIQTSGDGGATWSPGESIGLNHPKHQHGQSATIDSRANLYVSWTQFDKFGDANPGCESNILFSMSKNGKKWTEPAVISQYAGNCVRDDNTATGAVPAVTFDGKVLIAWSNKEKIYLDRSFNGGEWWLSNDITVADQKGGSDLAIPGHEKCNSTPVLITDNSKSHLRGSLYIAWADQRNGENDTDIWFTRSHNFGDNWSLPMRVNDDGKGKHQYLPWMTVDNTTGYIYIVYYDRRQYDDNQTDVYLAWSTDGGASFKNKLISETPFTPQEGEALASRPGISAHKGVVTPVWTRVDAGRSSLWTAIIRHEDLEKSIPKSKEK